jgi:hypothetical protein
MIGGCSGTQTINRRPGTHISMMSICSTPRSRSAMLSNG